MLRGANTASAAERLAQWRTTVARGLAQGVALLAFVPVTWIAYDGARFGRWVVTATALTFQTSNVICALAPLSLHTRVRWVLANLMLSLFLFLPMSGPTGGLGALTVLITVIAVLLLGSGEAMVVLGTLATGVTLWFYLLLHGTIARPMLVLSDLGDAHTAGRAAVTALCIGGVALIATGYLLRKLTATLFEAEQSIAAQKAEMEAKEAEARRRQRAEDELQRAQKMEALGRLAGGLAHDVNNNLTVALTNAELIERRAKGDPATLQLCAALLDAVDNAALLTRQLLALGRRDVARPELVTVESAFKRLRTMLPSILGKNRHLTVEVEPDLPNVLVDLRQLEQVLLNFALNARDAMPIAGQLTIRAECHGPAPDYDLSTSAESPAGPVRIHVTDNGSGIAADVLEHIFEPFFTTKGPDAGTGLGLAVARAFAESNGGRLGVITSSQGTTFTLELPAAEGVQTVVVANTQVGVPGGPPPVILAVDDDPRIRERMAAELRSAGYQVVEAMDGADALAQAENLAHIDLLCTDSAMPRLSGEQLILALGARHPEMRVLVCSAYVQDAALRQRLRAGHHTVLSKPFTAVELHEAVARALRQPVELAERQHPAA